MRARRVKRNGFSFPVEYGTLRGMEQKRTFDESTLVPGILGEQTEPVTHALTAEALGSGGLAVFATPAMIALMELTALKSVAPYLPEGCSTVGTRIDVRHLAATPEGRTVRCETELTRVDGRKLTFFCRAFDGETLIGEGEQGRYVVDNARFLSKLS